MLVSQFWDELKSPFVALKKNGKTSPLPGTKHGIHGKNDINKVICLETLN